MERIRVFDMFCGGGGSSLGARLAGAEVVGGVDMWPVATQAFGLNFPRAAVFTGDLRLLAPSDVIKQTGPIDLLLSSPECTHHTCARGNKPRSEESKETALQVVRYAKEMKPRWIVLENVTHMKPWPRYPELKSELELLGYNLREQILDSADFGVPQRRKRLFLIADLISEPATVYKTNEKVISAKDILDPDGTWPMTPLRKEGRAADTITRAERAIAALGDSVPFLLVYYGNDGAGGWQSLDVPLRTVTTVDRFALVVPTDSGHYMRMLQPNELRRAMGFPGNYIFPEVTKRNRIRLLGNAVCSPVMAAIIKSLSTKTNTLKNASPQASEHESHSDDSAPQESPAVASA
ncbi:DNA cytosine methyltransferase [Pseudomonas aeruginosa]|uniref:DNA cytosine methyltransferase n=2 Tax=Pseudomonas aeruginosa TaxID=287 RepID=UPI0009A2D0D4|nr:DNA cytosine methyltransferase [Pseudomonas aeruginosa]EKX8763908.1 DNA cytosine methyltransferase [Pseudomonas aeruginosa]POP54997.1 DNA cytosine methyltransferase [Pseudomonas aeruginosa]